MSSCSKVEMSVVEHGHCQKKELMNFVAQKLIGYKDFHVTISLNLRICHIRGEIQSSYFECPHEHQFDLPLEDGTLVVGGA